MHRPNEAPQDPPDDSEDTQTVPNLSSPRTENAPDWRALLRGPAYPPDAYQGEIHKLVNALRLLEQAPEVLHDPDVTPGTKRAFEARLHGLRALLRRERAAPWAWYEAFVEHAHHVCKRQEEPEPPESLKADRKELAGALAWADAHAPLDRWGRLNLEARIRAIRVYLKRPVSRREYARVMHFIIKHTEARRNDRGQLAKTC